MCPRTPHEIPFLQPDREQDVGRRRQGEQPVPEPHLRGGPEGHKEAEVEWMPDLLVQRASPQREEGIGCPLM
jgi:hypothetical protein